MLALPRLAPVDPIAQLVHITHRFSYLAICLRRLLPFLRPYVPSHVALARPRYFGHTLRLGVGRGLYSKPDRSRAANAAETHRGLNLDGGHK